MNGKFSLTRDAARDLDRRALENHQIPPHVLMENAGRGAASVLIALGISGPVTVLCGKGNNGGDGLVLARHLLLQGYSPTTVTFDPPDQFSPDTQFQWKINLSLPLDFILMHKNVFNKNLLSTILNRSEWIVDGLFGTGLRGSVRTPFDEIIDAINGSHANVLSLDIPSGLDADTGVATGPTVRAHHTVTFAALKQGFLVEASRAWRGRVHVADIGLPVWV